MDAETLEWANDTLIEARCRVERFAERRADGWAIMGDFEREVADLVTFDSNDEIVAIASMRAFERLMDEILDTAD